MTTVRDNSDGGDSVKIDRTPMTDAQKAAAADFDRLRAAAMTAIHAMADHLIGPMATLGLWRKENHWTDIMGSMTEETVRNALPVGENANIRIQEAAQPTASVMALWGAVESLLVALKEAVSVREFVALKVRMADFDGGAFGDYAGDPVCTPSMVQEIFMNGKASFCNCVDATLNKNGAGKRIANGEAEVLSFSDIDRLGGRPVTGVLTGVPWHTRLSDDDDPAKKSAAELAEAVRMTTREMLSPNAAMSAILLGMAGGGVPGFFEDDIRHVHLHYALSEMSAPMQRTVIEIWQSLPKTPPFALAAQFFQMGNPSAGGRLVAHEMFQMAAWKMVRLLSCEMRQLISGMEADRSAKVN